MSFGSWFMKAIVPAPMRRGFRAWIHEEMDRYWRRSAAEERHLCASAHHLPLEPGVSDVVVPLADSPPPATHRTVEDLPEPPARLAAGYFGNGFEGYLASGREHVDRMRAELEKHGFRFGPTPRILELGCAAGRMIRWLLEEAERGEVWGVDISAPHVYWCQQYLSPPFFFATCTTFPHLPFADHTFDLVYAGSVFTHTSELSDAWLLELRRIVRPGGFLYLTIHDRRSVDILLSQEPPSPFGVQVREFARRTGFLEGSFGMASIQRSATEAQVFHDHRYVRRIWGRFLDLRDIVPEAYGFQSAVILQRPS